MDFHQARAVASSGIARIDEDGTSGSEDSCQGFVNGNVTEVDGDRVADGRVAPDRHAGLARDGPEHAREGRSLDGYGQEATPDVDHVEPVRAIDFARWTVGPAVRQRDVEEQ